MEPEEDKNLEISEQGSSSGSMDKKRMKSVLGIFIH